MQYTQHFLSTPKITYQDVDIQQPYSNSKTQELDTDIETSGGL